MEAPQVTRVGQGAVRHDQPAGWQSMKPVPDPSARQPIHVAPAFARTIAPMEEHSDAW